MVFRQIVDIKSQWLSREVSHVVLADVGHLSDKVFNLL